MTIMCNLVSQRSFDNQKVNILLWFLSLFPDDQYVQVLRQPRKSLCSVVYVLVEIDDMVLVAQLAS
jgi:hypothetical protein